MRRKLLTIAFLVLAAATVAAVLLYFANPFGGGGQVNARDILTQAMTAFEKPDGVGLHSYQGVAQYTTKRTTSGNGLDDPSIILAKIPVPPTPVFKTTFSISFAQPNRSRIELETTTDHEPGQRTTIVSDGKKDWLYKSTLNEYASQPTEPFDREHDIRYTLGPGAYVSSIKDVLDQMESSSSQRVEIVGTDKLLGRSVYVIEVSEAKKDGDPDATPAFPRSTMRIYLDKKYLFTLGIDQTVPTGVTFSTRFTQIAFNKPIDDSEFVFTPPPGATEVSAETMAANRRGGGSSSSSSSGDVGEPIALPAGFLVPSYYVPGYEGRKTDSVSDKDFVSYRADFLIRQDNRKGYISAQELRGRGDLPDALKAGDKIVVRGNDAWLRSEDGLLHLAWQESDLVVYVISRGLSKDELLRVVGSMKVSTTRNDQSGPVTLATPSP
jgi:outer membrane lipoprotein-sorting protein